MLTQDSLSAASEVLAVGSLKGLGFYSARDNSSSNSYIVYVFQVETTHVTWIVSF